MREKPQPLVDFAKQLKKEIKNSRFTAKEVFKKVGLPPVYLSRWRKNNLRAPSYIEVAKFAEILNIPIEILIYGKVERPHVKMPLSDYRKFLNKIEKTVAAEKEKLDNRIV